MTREWLYFKLSGFFHERAWKLKTRRLAGVQAMTIMLDIHRKRKGE